MVAVPGPYEALPYYIHTYIHTYIGDHILITKATIQKHSSFLIYYFKAPDDGHIGRNM
jgi:hypothetical protein